MAGAADSGRACGTPRGFKGVVPLTDIVTRVGDRTLTLTNLDKVLYPSVGFTKAEVIDYYLRIAPVMLPLYSGPGDDQAAIPGRRWARTVLLLREERADGYAGLGTPGERQHQ